MPRFRCQEPVKVGWQHQEEKDNREEELVWRLYQSTWAAITEYCRLVAKTKEMYFLIVLEAGSQR